MQPANPPSDPSRAKVQPCPEQLATREKAILCGLFLSRWNRDGLRRLGFASFQEAFNVLGFAIGAKPSSIKNYRDELDPLFPNARQGWHGRPLRRHCERIYERFKDCCIDEMIAAISRITGYAIETPERDWEDPFSASVAKRLLTGRAAENFFLANFHRERAFAAATPKDVTLAGCGYDFRLDKAGRDSFLAVEVKGLATDSGSISLTGKEYAVAVDLGCRYFVYIVKNFEEHPYAVAMGDPVRSALSFARNERTVVQVAWVATV